MPIYHSSAYGQATLYSSITGTHLIAETLVRRYFVEERMAERLAQRYPLGRLVLQHFVDQVEKLRVFHLIALFVSLELKQNR